MTNDGLKQTVVAKSDRLSQIAQLPQATRDRIAHIDFTFYRKILLARLYPRNRRDLVNLFYFVPMFLVMDAHILQLLILNIKNQIFYNY